jgi:hypothetical protein
MISPRTTDASDVAGKRIDEQPVDTTLIVSPERVTGQHPLEQQFSHLRCRAEIEMKVVDHEQEETAGGLIMREIRLRRRRHEYEGDRHQHGP